MKKDVKKASKATAKVDSKVSEGNQLMEQATKNRLAEDAKFAKNKIAKLSGKPAEEVKPAEKVETPATATTPKVNPLFAKEKTKFGHVVGTQAGNIDEFLLKTNKLLSWKEIGDQMKLSEARIKSHILHLQNEKKLKFKVEGDKYQLLSK